MLQFTRLNLPSSNSFFFVLYLRPIIRGFRTERLSLFLLEENRWFARRDRAERGGFSLLCQGAGVHPP